MVSEVQMQENGFTYIVISVQHQRLQVRHIDSGEFIEVELHRAGGIVVCQMPVEEVHTLRKAGISYVDRPW